MSLAYFDDAEEEDMPKMVWQTDWSEVKRTIERWVTDLVRRPSTQTSPPEPLR